MSRWINDWKLLLVAAVLIGGAPFVPEPHLVGKIRWVGGGAVGMQAMDWLDLVWHASPLFLLLRLAVLRFRKPRTAS